MNLLAMQALAILRGPNPAGGTPVSSLRMFQDKAIFVTGGANSLGHDFIKLGLARFELPRVSLCSRAEKKQHDRGRAA